MLSRVLEAGVLAVCSLCVPSAAQAASIHGWVLHEGAPAAGASVKATNSAGQVVYATSGAGGWYQLNVGTGTWWVEASWQGYLGGVDHPLEVVAPQDVLSVNVPVDD